jgi:hypothetical protein
MLFCYTGVRELFEQEPPPPPRKTRAELMKDIDADYYGYRDDDDGILTPLEQNEERRGIYSFLMISLDKLEMYTLKREGTFFHAIMFSSRIAFSACCICQRVDLILKQNTYFILS